MEPELTDNAVATYEAEHPNSLAIRTLDDIKRVSLIFVKSGMFKGDQRLDEQTKMYQAGVKIIAGVEFGIQPFAAMRGINIINGNAEMSANLMAAKVKKHSKYDYVVKQWNHDGCVVTFYEIPRPGAPRSEWFELGDSSFDMHDAEAAGLTRNDTWRKFARNMFFARAMSNGVRIYCPDVFYGAPVYVDGEISGEFEHPAAEEPAAPMKAEPVEAELVTEATDEDPSDDQESEAGAGEQDTNQDDDQDSEVDAVEPVKSVRWMTDNQRTAIMSMSKAVGLDSKPKRLEFLSNELGREVKSTNELNFDEAQNVIAALEALKVAA